MSKKNKKRLSLENLKDLEIGTEKVPKEPKSLPVEIKEKPKIQSKPLSDEIVDQELDALFGQLNKWKVARSVNIDMQKEHRAKIRENKELRESLKSEIKEIRELANKTKEQRDKINEKVNQLKNQRTEANQKINEYKNIRDEKWTQVKQIREQFKTLINEKKGFKDKLKKAQEINKIIESLDWEIQTVSMSWEKECELMDEIENLFHELESMKELKEFKNISTMVEYNSEQLEKLKTEANQYHQLMLDFVNESNHIHNQILEMVKESEQYHSDMITNFEKANKLRTQEEEAQQNMINSIKELDPLKKGEEEILKELQIVRKKLSKYRQKEDASKTKDMQTVLDTKVEEALKKYKSGQKLTFDEFRILLDKDMLK